MLSELLNKATEENIVKYCRIVESFPALRSDGILSYLRENNYFTAPSSFKCHGGWIGGNFDHSVKVTELLLEYTAEEGLKWEREESPYIIGLFHDMCKCDQRGFKLKNGEAKVISLHPADTRHGDRSVELIEDHIIKLTEEEKLCIFYHMGVYGGDEDYQIRMAQMMEENSNIGYVQKADTVAAKMGI